MMCQNCGKNPAQVHSITNQNGAISDRHLCLACAQELAGVSLNIGDFIASVMGDAQNKASVHPATKTCPSCGMTQSEVMKLGKVGCAKCYEAFADVIEPILQRIHGRVQHAGKVPERIDDGSQKRLRQAEELKRQLDQAIQIEDFERAALLRDEIRAITATAGDPQGRRDEGGEGLR